MRTDSSSPSAVFQAETLNGVDVPIAQTKEGIRSEVLKLLSRNLSPHLNDLVDSLKSAVALCNKLTNDVEEMQGSVATCTASVRETKDKVPDQIVPMATTSASKALLESSKEQRLPPHLVNRLLLRKSLTNKNDSANLNGVRSSFAKAPRDFFAIQAPPLPNYTPPDITLNIGGSIVIVPMQPPLILSASPAVGGISIEGRLDQSSLTLQFQPANVYYLYSYTPTDGDAIKVQLGIAWTKIAVITAPNLPLSFVAVNLPPNSVHFFVMHGVDALGRTGEWSNIVKAIVN
ncbi:unnamed protein product [Hydatigera taeniaeformis]|uniref:Fibronectin type-III domain-containing protein n=1 Tax=Hydatigena taeniaeformis TaxID=6205 RepID=A0A0R3WRL4_HYDTA|nr:unnamed protein product [Hydatigera taeniaeformis]